MHVQTTRRADLAEFAAVFEEVHGQPLDAALAGMTAEVHGTDLWDGCIEGEAPVLAWTRAGLLDTNVESACGDGSILFGKYDETRQGSDGLLAVFAVEIPEPGRYDLTVSRADGEPDPVHGSLRRCSNTAPQGVGSSDGGTGHGLFDAGRFVLKVQYWQRREPRGGAHVRLEYVGPPPS